MDDLMRNVLYIVRSFKRGYLRTFHSHTRRATNIDLYARIWELVAENRADVITVEDALKIYRSAAVYTTNAVGLLQKVTSCS